MNHQILEIMKYFFQLKIRVHISYNIYWCGTYNNTPRCGINKYMHLEDVGFAPFGCHAITNSRTFCQNIAITKWCVIQLKMNRCLIVVIVYRVSGNDVSNFHMFDIKFFTYWCFIQYKTHRGAYVITYEPYMIFLFFNGNKEGQGLVCNETSGPIEMDTKCLLYK